MEGPMSLHSVRLLVLLAAVLTPKTIAVETGSIEGHVRDAATAAPVANARILIVGTTFGTTTNAGSTAGGPELLFVKVRYKAPDGEQSSVCCCPTRTTAARPTSTT
jgi:hypothetical protein